MATIAYHAQNHHAQNHHAQNPAERARTLADNHDLIGYSNINTVLEPYGYIANSCNAYM